MKKSMMMALMAMCGLQTMAQTEIVIPEWTTEIEAEAYKGRTDITSVVMASSVTKIGSGAFAGCTGLTSINIPAGIESIEEFTFYGCTGLTSVNIPESVTSIGYHAFDGCTGLTSIKMPEGLTEIEIYAFAGCTGLTSVSIPEGIRRIGKSTFRGCTGLTSVNIPEGAKIIENAAFAGCSSLAIISLPESIEHIERSAFKGCTALTSINIPESVTYIGYQAFDGCTGLKTISVAGQSLTVEDAYTGCDAIETACFNATEVGGTARIMAQRIYIPQGTTEMYRDALGHQNYIEMPEMSVTDEISYCAVENIEQDGNEMDITMSVRAQPGHELRSICVNGEEIYAKTGRNKSASKCSVKKLDANRYVISGLTTEDNMRFGTQEGTTTTTENNANDQDEEAKYYDMNGREVMQPTAPGIYVKKQGNKSQIMMIK